MGWSDVPPGGMGFPGMGPESLESFTAGFWQPWGARHQPPNLIFNSATTLSSTSMTALAEHAEQMRGDVEDDVVEEEKGKSSGGGKGSSSWEKGGWESGSSWGKGNWEQGGGWRQNSGWEKSNWDSGGWGSSNWDKGSESRSKGKDGGGKGKDGKGKKSRDGGEKGAEKGGEKGIEKGDRSGERGAERHNDGSSKPKWTVRNPQPAVEAPAATPPPVTCGLETAASYNHDFRKYDRQKFEEIAKAMHDEALTKPVSLSALGADMPIFRDAPSVALAAA